MTKSALRLALKDIPASANLTDLLIKNEKFRNAQSVILYYPIKNEADTVPAILYALKSGKKVALPKCGENYSLAVYEITGLDALIKGSYGIMEPDISKCRLADKNEFELCVIPAVAYDLAGNRLGRGLGYYDRFLSDYNGYKLGICPQSRIVNSLPCDNCDIAVDYIITEGKERCLAK